MALVTAWLLRRLPDTVAGALAGTLAGALAAAMLLSFLGALGAAFDSLAHFRAHLAVLLAFLSLVAVLRGRLVSFAMSGAFAAAGLATTLPLLLGAPATEAAAGRPVYSLLQMNLRRDAEPAEALRRIAQLSPDILTLQEVSPAWRARLDALSERYPFAVDCAPPGEEGGVMILSRRPMLPGGEICLPERRFAATRIDFNGRPATIAVQHLTWPWPYGQNAQIAALAQPLGALAVPLVVAGDFNAAPWSAAVRTYARLAGTEVLAGVGPTFAPSSLPDALRRGAGLPIDHVLVSPGVAPLALTTPASTASDHLPILFRFTLDTPG